MIRDNIAGYSEIVSDKNIYPMLKAGFVINREDDNFIFRPLPEPAMFSLNLASWLIFLLCDGTLNIANIKDFFRSHYPDHLENIDNDISDILLSLFYSDIVEFLETPPNTPNTLIGVSFCNFPEDFDKTDNYFLRILLHNFSVLLVDPLIRKPDLLFYSVLNGNISGESYMDLPDTLKIMIASKGHPIDFTKCDYLFSDHTVTGDKRERHFYIPINLIYSGWENYEEYKPENVFPRFYNALFARKR